jgi:hypothetical protein
MLLMVSFGVNLSSATRKSNFGGNATVHFTGGAGPSVVVWSPSPGSLPDIAATQFVEPQAFYPNGGFIPTGTGIYSFSYRDAVHQQAGCDFSVSVTVNGIGNYVPTVATTAVGTLNGFTPTCTWGDSTSYPNATTGGIFVTLNIATLGH